MTSLPILDLRHADDPDGIEPRWDGDLGRRILLTDVDHVARV